jgi:hypothetical protein
MGRRADDRIDLLAAAARFAAVSAGDRVCGLPRSGAEDEA